MKFFKIFSALALLLIFCSLSQADIPNLINLQGILDSAGNPLANKTKSVEFKIYDDAVAGNVWWSETQSVTTNAGGVFNVILGSSNPIPDTAFEDTLRYLGIKVGGDAEMTPRQQIVSNAYGYRVAHFVPDFGSGNTFIGRNAGNLTMTGDLNTASGANALQSNTTGSSNTASGRDALFSNTTGSVNTASGSGALGNNTTGNWNTASGFLALGFNTTGERNTASGFRALQSNTTGSNNTAIGYNANVSAVNLTNATAIGANAVVSTSNSLVLGGTGGFAVNVGIGTSSPNEQLEMTGNLRLPTSTASVGVIKAGADRFIHNYGINNTFVGIDAGNLTMTGTNNTASGSAALQSNTTGTDNTASGLDALKVNTTGNRNTACGLAALRFNTTGTDNTASGNGALFNNTTGSNNTAIGNGADVSAGNLTNATAIGNGATVNASNKIRLGNASVTVLECQVGLTVVSDRNEKENFQPVDGEEVLKKLRGLEVSSWNLKGHDPRQFRHYGPVAQDFFAAFGDDGVGKIGTATTLNSGDIAGILMIAVQALEKRTGEVSQLKTQIEELKRMLKQLQDEQSEK